jgi:hypothetical protein
MSGRKTKLKKLLQTAKNETPRNRHHQPFARAVHCNPDQSLVLQMSKPFIEDEYEDV